MIAVYGFPFGQLDVDRAGNAAEWAGALITGAAFLVAAEALLLQARTHEAETERRAADDATRELDAAERHERELEEAYRGVQGSFEVRADGLYVTLTNGTPHWIHDIDHSYGVTNAETGTMLAVTVPRTLSFLAPYSGRTPFRYVEGPIDMENTVLFGQVEFSDIHRRRWRTSFGMIERLADPAAVDEEG